MIQATQLAKRPDVQLDLSDFGQEPMFLARVSDDPMHIGVVGIVATLVMLAAPGFNWLLLAAFWLFNGNDIAWALGEDTEEEEEYQGPTLEAEAQAVTDTTPADCLGNPIVKVEQPAWPPVTEVAPVTAGFTRAKDIIKSSTPEDLLNLMGDDAPGWLKLQVAQNTFEYPEPYPEERLDAPAPTPARTPEALVEPVVQAVREPVQSSEPTNNQFISKPVAEPVHELSVQLDRMLRDAPYVIPIQGPKGKVYHIVKTAILAGKSQNWMVQNLFGASKGNNYPYKDSVSYIQWVKSN